MMLLWAAEAEGVTTTPEDPLPRSGVVIGELRAAALAEAEESLELRSEAMFALDPFFA